MKNLIKGLKTISFIFVLSMMFGIVNVSALTSEDGVYEYTVNEDGNTVTINTYNGTDNDVIIPSKIDGKNVTIIGSTVRYDEFDVDKLMPFYSGAFQSKQLTKVTIPNGVTKIGVQAFYSNQLTSITLPNSVIEIGTEAFRSNKLTSLTLPNSVTTIGASAFFQNKLTHVTIPNSVTIIDKNSFSENQLTEIVIPESVLTIGFRAFEDNNLLTKAVILNDSNSMIIGDKDYDVFRGVSADFKLYGYANSSVSEYATKANEKGITTEFVELKNITSSMISDITTQYYKGSALKPIIKVNDGTKDLKLDTDYTVSYKDNDKVGTATVTITGKGDYEYSEVSKTFTIAKQQYSVSINPLTGATITPSNTINVDFDGSQKYTIKAIVGYKITSILVDGVEMLSSLKDDVLTISNPTKDMSIEVKTEEVKEEVTEPVKDTPVEDEVKEDNPKTFDGILLYVGLGILSVIGLSGTGLYIKKSFN